MREPSYTLYILILILILLETSRNVRSDEGQELARKLSCQFIETSAKTRQGVEEV